MPDTAHVIRDMDTALEAMSRAPTIALDLETSGLKPWADDIAVVSLSDGESTAVLHTRGTIPTNLVEFLRHKEWLTQNGTQFDNIFLYRHYESSFLPRAYDLRIAESVVDSSIRRRSYSLGALMLHHLGENLKQDIDHLSWMNPVLTDEQVFYCASDVESLHRIRASQQSKVNRPWPSSFMQIGQPDSTHKAIDLENRVAPIISRMILNGIPLDKTILADAQAQQQTKIDTIRKLLPSGFNPLSPPQVKALLKAQGLPVENTTSATLESLNHPVADAVLALRHGLKRLSMFSPEWIEKYLSPDKRIHARYNQIGTATGRMSCAEPNMQQIPQNMRSVFGLEHHQMAAFDFSQLEIRVGAKVFNDGSLHSAILSDDLHMETVKLILPEMDAPPRGYRSWKDRSDSELREIRQLCKTLFFTFFFGGKPASIQHKVPEIVKHIASSGENTASILDRIWLQLEQGYPACSSYFRYMSRVSSQAKRENIPVIQHLGGGYTRTHLPGDITSTALINSGVQSLAAQGLKHCLVNLPNNVLPYLSGCVHDELVFTLPDGHLDRLVEPIRLSMEKSMKTISPDMAFPVTPTIGRYWTHG